MEVPAIRRERRAPGHETPHDHVEGVDDRHAEDEQRRGHLRRAEDREHREHRADERHPGRAEEDLRRVHVEHEEPGDRAGEGEVHPRDERLVHRRQQRGRAQRDGGDAGHAGGEPVEAIDEVEGVVHADDPKDGEPDRDRRRELDQPVTARVVHEVDADAGRDDDRRDRDVAKELPAGAQIERVVEQADAEAERGGERREREARRADLFRDEERLAVQAVDQPEREDREPERDGDPETADPRDRRRVVAPAARDVEQTEPSRERADERCHTEGQEECEQRRAREEQERGRADRVEEARHQLVPNCRSPASPRPGTM